MIGWKRLSGEGEVRGWRKSWKKSNATASSATNGERTAGKWLNQGKSEEAYEGLRGRRTNNRYRGVSIRSRFSTLGTAQHVPATTTSRWREGLYTQ